MDIGAIRLMLSHPTAVHGLPMSIEQIDLGRIALKRLDPIGKSNQPTARPPMTSWPSSSASSIGPNQT